MEARRFFASLTRWMQGVSSTTPSPGGGDGDREDFGFLEHPPRYDEPNETAAHHGAMRNDMTVEKQMFEFAITPSAVE